MGAFDCAIASLGLRGYPGHVSEERSAPRGEEIEPYVGARVKVFAPCDIVTGEIVYVGESVVVVKRDNPKIEVGKWTKYETAYPRHWSFYEVKGDL